MLVNDYVFLQNWKQSILWTKMHFIHSVGPVSKGLGPVLDHFDFFLFVRWPYFFGKNSRRTTNQIGVALKYTTFYMLHICTWNKMYIYMNIWSLMCLTFGLIVCNLIF